MVQYNPKDWFTFIFRFHKADTFRTLLPLILGISIYAGLVAYLEVEILKLSESSHVKNISLMHNLLGFALSMLLVFRTNTAYDRWWEGRKQWGSLVNASRNLAIKLSAFLPKENTEARAFFRRTIPAFAHLLHSHLHNETTRTALFEVDPEWEKHLDEEKHMPNQMACAITRKINKLVESGDLDERQQWMLNGEITAFTDICGACERIKNTPIPFSYSAFLKKFIFVYVMTLPFGFVFNLGYYVIPIVAFIFYVLASLELIAEEIEDPFGGDPNDLPTDKIARNIQVHIHEII